MKIRRGRLGLIRGRGIQWTSQPADCSPSGISLWLSGYCDCSVSSRLDPSCIENLQGLVVLGRHYTSHWKSDYLEIFVLFSWICAYFWLKSPFKKNHWCNTSYHPAGRWSSSCTTKHPVVYRLVGMMLWWQFKCLNLDYLWAERVKYDTHIVLVLDMYFYVIPG